MNEQIRQLKLELKNTHERLEKASKTLRYISRLVQSEKVGPNIPLEDLPKTIFDKIQQEWPLIERKL